jgi:serine/threonine protein kinase
VSSSDELAQLVDALLGALDRGDAIDVTALEAQFKLSEDEVSRCLDGLRAVHALGDAVGDSQSPIHAGSASLPMPAPADYECIEEIGRGGMGIVYRARHRETGREVALKIIRPWQSTLEPSLARFRQEAKALARFDHPGIVGIHDVGRVKDSVYFTMDLIEGESLDRFLHLRKMPPELAIGIVRQVARAMAYVHEQGLIHRDLKPANILLDEDQRAFVSDFGLVRQLDDDRAEITRTGQILGTPNYMSPEQAQGQTNNISAATDVWALGCILYECLCGVGPFEGAHAAKVLHEVRHRDPVSPRKLSARMPHALDAIISKCLAKNPRDRYADAGELLEDLDAFEAGKSVRAFGDSDLRWVRENLHRHGATLGIILCAVVGTLVLSRARSSLAPPEATIPASEVARAIGNGEAQALALRSALANWQLDRGDRETSGLLVDAACRQMRAYSFAGEFKESSRLLARVRSWHRVAIDTAAAEAKNGPPAKGPIPNFLDQTWQMRMALEEGVRQILEGDTKAADLSLKNVMTCLGFSQNIPEVALEDVVELTRDLLKSESNALRIWAARLFVDPRSEARWKHDTGSTQLAALMITADLVRRHTQGSHINSVNIPGTMASDAVAENAYALASDTQLPDRERNCAAFGLSLIARLGFHHHRRAVSSWDEVYRQECLDYWQELRPHGFATRRRMILDRYFAGAFSVTARVGGAFSSWAGHKPKSGLVADARAWWQAHRDEDPMLTWRNAEEAMSGASEPLDPKEVLSLWRDRPANGDLWALILRALRAPKKTQPLNWRNMDEWAACLRDRPEDTYVLQGAFFRTEGFRLPAHPWKSWVEDLPRESSGCHAPPPPRRIERTLFRPAPLESTFHPIPFAGSERTLRPHGFRCDLETTFRSTFGEPSIKCQLRLQTFGYGRHLGVTKAGSLISPMGIASEHLVFEAAGDEHPELTIGVAALAPRSAMYSDQSWTRRDWEAWIREKIADLADVLTEDIDTPESFRHQIDLMQTAQLAGFFGLTECKNDLRQLAQIFPEGKELKALNPKREIEAALALLGDADALKEFEQREARKSTAKTAGGQRRNDSIAPSEFWSFAFLNSPSEITRERARGHLQRHLSSNKVPRILAATDLLSPEDRSQLVPRSAGQAHSSRANHTPALQIFLVFMGVISLLIIAAMIDTVRGKRSFRAMIPRIAIILSIALAYVTIVVRETDITPQIASWLLGLGGSIALVFQGHPGSRIATLGYVGCCAVELVPGLDSAWLANTYCATQGLVVSGVIVMGFACGVRDFAQRTWLGAFPLIPYLGALALGTVLTLVVRLLDMPSLSATTFAAGSAGLIYLATVVMWFIRRGSRGPGRLPWLIVFFLVLPVLSVAAERLMAIAAGVSPSQNLSSAVSLSLAIGVFIALMASILCLLWPQNQLARHRSARTL